MKENHPGGHYSNRIIHERLYFLSHTHTHTHKLIIKNEYVPPQSRHSVWKQKKKKRSSALKENCISLTEIEIWRSHFVSVHTDWLGGQAWSYLARQRGQVVSSDNLDLTSRLVVLWNEEKHSMDMLHLLKTTHHTFILFLTSDSIRYICKKRKKKRKKYITCVFM